MSQVAMRDGVERAASMPGRGSGPPGILAERMRGTLETRDRGG